MLYGHGCACHTGVAAMLPPSEHAVLLMLAPIMLFTFSPQCPLAEGCVHATLVQAAEERALAGKCGNPLCSQPPAAGERPHGGGGRYHISTSQQAVYERGGYEPPLYCGPQCATAVKQFASRLGGGAAALERFSAMYSQLKQQEQQQKQAQGQQQNGTAASVHLEAPPAPASAPVPTPGAASSSGTSSNGAAAANGAASAAAAATGTASSTLSGSPSSRDAVPGGIMSRTTLAPRLAVEQVAVTHIDSSAGQFGDFTRKIKPKPRPAAAAGSGATPPPKGVLKKQSKFAAGTDKVPIMLAEVKVRGQRSGKPAIRPAGQPGKLKSRVG